MQIELQDFARAARAASAKTGSSRCSACEARGVTLWKVAGHLVCASCRTVKRAGPSRSSALSDERLARLRDLQRKLNPPEAIRDAWR